jgi:hypothetical protein
MRERFKYQRLPKGLTAKERLGYGAAYAGTEGLQLIADDARYKAEKLEHSLARSIKPVLHSCPGDAYRANYDRCFGKRK